MEYTILAKVQRVVTEVYECKVEDTDPETACDIVFEHMSEYPDSEYQLAGRRRVLEETEKLEILSVEHKREEANDVSSEEVFGDNDGNDDQIA